MEIVKLLQNQRPTELAQLKIQLRDDRVFDDLALAQIANQTPPMTTVSPMFCRTHFASFSATA